MIFEPTEIDGVVVVDAERREDERGFFARTWSDDEFRDRGLDPAISQISISFNRKARTLRGLHLQRPPHEEAKLVRCTMGRVFDVAVDLRPTSPTCRRWVGVELTAENRRALFVPKGCAHGFLTLTDDAELLYLITTPYAADAAAGVRWDDPAFAIDWPAVPEVISDRDATYPDFAG